MAEADPETLKEPSFDYDGFTYTWAFTTKVFHSGCGNIGHIVSVHRTNCLGSGDGAILRGIVRRHSGNRCMIQGQFGTDLVGDTLAPASYQAVATYSASTSSKVATGYSDLSDIQFGEMFSAGIARANRSGSVSWIAEAISCATPVPWPIAPYRFRMLSCRSLIALSVGGFLLAAGTIITVIGGVGLAITKTIDADITYRELWHIGIKDQVILNYIYRFIKKGYFEKSCKL